MAIPRRDIKPLAKELIEKFGSFADVIAASEERLKECGLSENSIIALKTVEAAALRLARARVKDRPALSSWEAVIDYCAAKMARAETEEFRVLFLDRKNALIEDETLGRGTVDHTPVYPREVVKRALELSASALILVHNHPSGDPTPSRADILMTREIATSSSAGANTRASRRLGCCRCASRSSGIVLASLLSLRGELRRQLTGLGIGLAGAKTIHVSHCRDDIRFSAIGRRKWLSTSSNCSPLSRASP
jgi:DNA repair protein RadC